MIQALQKATEGRGRSTFATLWWMVILRVTAFVMVFSGVPLPMITPQAPKPLQVVKDLLEPKQAEAVQIKRIQTGSIYFDLDDITQTVEIQQVDQTKTVVMLYQESDATATNTSGSTSMTQAVLFRYQFESDTSLIISRDGANTTILYGSYVKYYIMEFEDGVFVQRGISSFIAGSASNPLYTTKYVGLPTAVTAANAMGMVDVSSALNANTADTDEMAMVTA